MKKYLAILAITFMLTSCTNVNNSKAPNNTQPEAVQPQQEGTVLMDSPDDQSEIVYFGQYQMSEEGFSEYVKDNAIDKDYEVESTEFLASTEFNTQSWVELENKYVKMWDAELNNTYKKAMEKLNEKEQAKLKEAQKGWLEFHTKETEFVEEAWNDLGLGTIGRVQLVMAAKDRLRERTLQLMEYYNMLGGEIEFVYQGSTK
jgi:uncharacterized protein YecT (DUF1311 family)